MKKITTTRQTVRINGKRTILTTRNGRVTMRPALPQEWELQAAQVRRLRSLPTYGKRFLLAGDQNAAKRGPKAQAQALAAGLTAGEPDVRIYMAGGKLGLIENKVGTAKPTLVQADRHAGLRAMGFDVVVINASSLDEAADKAVAVVRGWLAANDNNAELQKKIA